MTARGWKYSRSIPELLLPMQVQCRPGLDLAVSVDLRLAREAAVLFVADPGNEAERVEQHVQLLPQPLLTDVLFAGFDQHAATAAQSVPQTVQRLVDSGVQFDAVLEGLGPEVRPFGDFDRLFFIQDLDGRHGRCGEQKSWGLEKSSSVRG